MSLALSTCVLFMSLMHLINGAQLFGVLFVLASAAAVLLTVIVPLTRIYASHKLDYSIVVLNLI